MTSHRRNSIYEATIAGMYDLESTIGKGHFAVVKLARHVFTGEKVAVKVIDKTRLDAISREHLFQEVRCMKLVQHPHIVRLYEVIDTQSKLFLVLELGDYDLYDYITRQQRGVDETESQRYFSQIVQAISYCHELHVVHRDLKPENVVFFEKLGMVKLTDFGFSNLYFPGQKLETACGSLAYSAPEILLGDSYDAPAVDVWSLGVILYMLVCGKLPFQEANDSETLTKIMDCSFILPDHLSDCCRKLIKRMLIRDPSCRITVEELAQDPWIQLGNIGHAENLPLISRHQLSESEHQVCLQQIVSGGIAPNEEMVLRALETDQYSSLTATYYLLAERLLRKQRFEQAKLLNNSYTLNNSVHRTGDADDNKTLLHNSLTMASRRHSLTTICTSRLDVDYAEQAAIGECGKLPTPPGSSATLRNVASVGNLPNRKDSKILISSLAEEDEDIISHIGSSIRVRSRSPSLRSSSASLHELRDLIVRAGGSSGGSRSPSPGNSRSQSPTIAKYKTSGPIPATTRRQSAHLPNVSSSPHLLDICEEPEDDSIGIWGSSQRLNQIDTYSAVRSVRRRQAVVSPDVIRRYDRPAGTLPNSGAHNRCRRGHRSASCSSSEASDDEERRIHLMNSSNPCHRLKDDDEDDSPPSCGPSYNSASVSNGITIITPNSNKSKSNGGGVRNNASNNGKSASGGRHYSNKLDIRGLARRLRRLALAPIREIPSFFTSRYFVRHTSMRKAATSATLYDGSNYDIDNSWCRSLKKPVSCERLSSSSSSSNKGTQNRYCKNVCETSDVDDFSPSTCFCHTKKNNPSFVMPTMLQSHRQRKKKKKKNSASTNNVCQISKQIMPSLSYYDSYTALVNNFDHRFKRTRY